MQKMIWTMLALVLALPALAPAAADDPAALYKKSCVLCHGAKGDGKGMVGKKMKPPATDFTDAKAMAGLTDDQLADATKNGAKAKSIKVDKKMPAYSKFSDAQIKGLVGVIRGFGGAKAAPGDAGQAGAPVKDTATAKDSAPAAK